MGLAMMNAQRELIQAQTENVKADTTKKLGVDTREGEARIADLTQGVRNKQAQERLTYTQNDIEEIKAAIAEGTQGDAIREIRYISQSAYETLQQLRYDNEITRETMEAKIGIVQGELIGIGIANELKKAQVGLTEAQTKQAIEQVQQAWTKLGIEEKEVLIKGDHLALEKFIKDVPESVKLTTQVVGDIVKEVVNVKMRTRGKTEETLTEYGDGTKYTHKTTRQ